MEYTGIHGTLTQVIDVSLTRSLLMEKEFINIHKNWKQHIATVEYPPLWLLTSIVLPYEELNETLIPYTQTSWKDQWQPSLPFFNCLDLFPHSLIK